MINLVLYLAVLAIILYMSVIYGNMGFALIAFAGIFFVAAAYGYILLQLFFLRFSLRLPIAVAGTGESLELEIGAENKGVFPVTKLVFLLRYENLLTGERGTLKCWGAADARCKMAVSASLSAGHCGKYRAVLRGVRIYDLTGLFYLRVWTKKRAEWYVMPRIYDTVVAVSEPSRHFMGEADVYDDTMSGDDASEVLRIRPFRDGDRIQSIHWKMSAKADELMVRENSQPLGCPVVLFLDFFGKGKNMEAFLLLVASLSFALMDAKCAHYAAWYSSRQGDVVRLRVDDEESFYLFLMMLGEERRQPVHRDVQELYREKYRAEAYVTGILLDGSLCVKVGERFEKTFTPGKLEQELSGVEFVV
ncbi:MAG: DUF58 domain-containing protein [Roseburia sp.]